MSDPARDLVDAILVVTPVHPVRGDVITGWTYEPDHPAVAAKLVHPWRPERGNPRPVAVRQAVAARPVIYREVADWILAEHGHGDPVVKALAIAIQLRATDLADQIDTTSTEEAP